MHRNPAMLYFFALNKSKTIHFYYSSPIIEIGIIYSLQENQSARILLFYKTLSAAWNSLQAIKYSSKKASLIGSIS